MDEKELLVDETVEDIKTLKRARRKTGFNVVLFCLSATILLLVFASNLGIVSSSVVGVVAILSAAGNIFFGVLYKEKVPLSTAVLQTGIAIVHFMQI